MRRLSSSLRTRSILPSMDSWQYENVVNEIVPWKNIKMLLMNRYSSNFYLCLASNRILCSTFDICIPETNQSNQFSSVCSSASFKLRFDGGIQWDLLKSEYKTYQFDSIEQSIIPVTYLARKFAELCGIKGDVLSIWNHKTAKSRRNESNDLLFRSIIRRQPW